MDLSVFKNDEIQNCINGYFGSCAAINRLIAALKYYATLNVKDDENDREIFRSFMEKVYTQIVDDNNHFMDLHSNQLIQIADTLMDNEVCTMKGCVASQRHFESENNLNVVDDQNMNFYVNLMDSLHFIIFHCYDAGFRVKANEEENDNKDGTLFDADFARMNTIIRKTDFKTEPFERISTGNNTKFSLTKEITGDTTFLDELYKELSSEIERIYVEKLQQTVDGQEYESDSIKLDVLKYGNIANKANNKDVTQSILRFISATKVRSATFSVGLRFYYWDFYKDKNENKGFDWNKHDHAGYTVSELFVKPKFTSFKEEITNYPNLNIQQYESAKTKAEKFLKSEMFKKMSAKYTYPNMGSNGANRTMFLHYGIAHGALVSFHHILSLIFYTDYSNLSRDFSATFRKIHVFETLKRIKQRNDVYFHMAKYLRELVECFGQCAYGDTFPVCSVWEDNIYYDLDNPLDALRGPFYCGMNFQMNVGSFAMRLNSPSSTSKQFAVAVKFSGPEGIVFTFDTASADQFQYLRAFNCSQISRFKEEDEVLFFGGFYRIKVVNLRLVQTSQSMEQFVSAFFYFHAVLSDGGLHRLKMGKNNFGIINALINLTLCKQTNTKLPPFIVDCFKAFTRDKNEIIFNLYVMDNNGDERINNLLFHSLQQGEYIEKVERKDDDLSNVIRSGLFVIFPNLQSLIINTLYGFKFCFSLMALLNAINGTNVGKIVIKSEAYNGDCWTKKAWNLDKERLQKEYAAKEFNIAMKMPKQGCYYLIITKL